MKNRTEADNVICYFLTVYPEGREEGAEALTATGVPRGLADVVWQYWLAVEHDHNRMLEDERVLRHWAEAVIEQYNAQDPFEFQQVVVDLHRDSTDSNLRILDCLFGRDERELRNWILNIQDEHKGFRITEIRDLVTNRIVSIEGLDEWDAPF